MHEDVHACMHTTVTHTMRACILTNQCIGLYIYVCVCARVCVCVGVCLFVCLFVWLVVYVRVS